MSRTTLDERVGELTGALASGEYARAVERAGAVRQLAAPEAIPLLEDLAAALSADETGRAWTLLNAVVDRVNADEADRTARVERSSAARSALGPGDRERIAGIHARQTGHADMALAELYTVVPAYLARPPDDRTESDREEAVKAVRRTIDYERARRGVEERAVAVSETVEVPPTLAVLATKLDPPVVGPGDARTMAVVVGNVGDAPVEGVTVTADPDGAVGVEPAERSVGSLSARGRATVEFTVTGAAGDGAGTGADGESGTTVAGGPRTGAADGSVSVEATGGDVAPASGSLAVTVAEGVDVGDGGGSGSTPLWLGAGVVGALAVAGGAAYLVARVRSGDGSSDEGADGSRGAGPGDD